MTKKVLFVDDEPHIRGLAEATLGGDDRFELLFAADGAQALNVWRTEHPDLVFLDLVMPMDGFKVCEEMCKIPRADRGKVVVLSGLTQPTDLAAAMALGVDVYMTKPFSPTELLAQVEEMLAE